MPANEKHIIIDKTPFNGVNFTQIVTDDWIDAVNTLTRYNSFKVYMFLAQNQNGYDKTLNKVEIMQKLNMKKTAYDDAIADLKAYGYLESIKGNSVFKFHTARIKEIVTATAENEENKEQPVLAGDQSIKAGEKDELTATAGENNNLTVLAGSDGINSSNEVEQTATAVDTFAKAWGF